MLRLRVQLFAHSLGSRSQLKPNKTCTSNVKNENALIAVYCLKDGKRLQHEAKKLRNIPGLEETTHIPGLEVTITGLEVDIYELKKQVETVEEQIALAKRTDDTAKLSMLLDERSRFQKQKQLVQKQLVQSQQQLVQSRKVQDFCADVMQKRAHVMMSAAKMLQDPKNHSLFALDVTEEALRSLFPQRANLFLPPTLKLGLFAQREMATRRTLELLGVPHEGQEGNAHGPWSGKLDDSVQELANDDGTRLKQVVATPRDKSDALDIAQAQAIHARVVELVKHFKKVRSMSAGCLLYRLLAPQPLTFDSEFSFGAGPRIEYAQCENGPSSDNGIAFEKLLAATHGAFCSNLKEDRSIVSVTSAPRTGKSLFLDGLVSEINQIGYSWNPDCIQDNRRLAVPITYNSATPISPLDKDVNNLAERFWWRFANALGSSVGVPAPEGCWDECSAIQLYKLFFNTSTLPLIVVDEFSKMVDIITLTDVPDKPERYSHLVNGFRSYFAVYSGFTRDATKQFATASGRGFAITFLPPASKTDQRLRMLPQLALLKSHEGKLHDFVLNWALIKSCPGLVGFAAEKVLKGEFDAAFEPPLLLVVNKDTVEQVLKWYYGPQRHNRDVGAKVEATSLVIPVHFDDVEQSELYLFPIFRYLTRCGTDVSALDRMGRIAAAECIDITTLIRQPIQASGRGVRAKKDHRMEGALLERLIEASIKLTIAGHYPHCQMSTRIVDVFPCVTASKKWTGGASAEDNPTCSPIVDGKVKNLIRCSPIAAKDAATSTDDQKRIEQENANFVKDFFLGEGLNADAARCAFMKQSPETAHTYTNPSCEGVILFISKAQDGSFTRAAIVYDAKEMQNVRNAMQQLKRNATSSVESLKDCLKSCDIDGSVHMFVVSVSEREAPGSAGEFRKKLVALLGGRGSRPGDTEPPELFSADEVLGSLRLLLDKFDGYACTRHFPPTTRKSTKKHQGGN